MVRRVDKQVSDDHLAYAIERGESRRQIARRSQG
jgi:hypothetical protein